MYHTVDRITHRTCGNQDQGPLSKLRLHYFFLQQNQNDHGDNASQRNKDPSGIKLGEQAECGASILYIGQMEYVANNR